MMFVSALLHQGRWSNMVVCLTVGVMLVLYSHTQGLMNEKEMELRELFKYIIPVSIVVTFAYYYRKPVGIEVNSSSESST